MQLFKIITVLFFFKINCIYYKNFIIKNIKLRKKKNYYPVFTISKRMNKLKICFKYKLISFKILVKKKMTSKLKRKRRRRLKRIYAKKIIRMVLLKLFIFSKNNSKLFIRFKIKKIEIKNKVKKKGPKKKKRYKTKLGWIFFLLIRKLFIKSKISFFNFKLIFIKSHSKKNEKLKKLRRK